MGYQTGAKELAESQCGGIAVEGCEKQKRIPAALDLLRHRRDQMEKSLHNLINRLQPVLRSHVPSPAVPVAPACTSDVQLEECLLTIARDLEMTRDLLDQISNRVEL